MPAKLSSRKLSYTKPQNPQGNRDVEPARLCENAQQELQREKTGEAYVHDFLPQLDKD